MIDRAKVTVLFDGVPLEALAETRFEIFNAGTAPVAAEAFARPIGIELPEGIRILSHHVVGIAPAGWVRIPELWLDGNRLTLMPCALKRGDRVRMSILSDHALKSSDFHINACMIDGAAITARQIGGAGKALMVTGLSNLPTFLVVGATLLHPDARQHVHLVLATFGTLLAWYALDFLIACILIVSLARSFAF